MSWLTFCLVLLAILCAVEAVWSFRRVRNDGEERLRALRRKLENAESTEDRASIVRESGPIRFPQIPLVRAGEALLYRAGVRNTFWRFSAQSLALGFIVAIGALQFFFAWFPALVLGAAVGSLPWMVVGSMKRRRMAIFEAQLPEALDLICRALRAGHALSSGLRMVGDELDDPVAGEFTQVADEIALGLEARHALSNLCDRIDLADLAFFSTAVLIQRETGGNLAEIMERLGYVIRERHKFFGKVRAMTAQNRGAAIVLLFTPPTFLLLMYMVRKEFVEPLWTTHSGNILGICVFGVSIFGYIIARRLAVVKT